MEIEPCSHRSQKYTPDGGWICRICDCAIPQDDTPRSIELPMFSVTTRPTSSGAPRAIQIDKTNERWDKDGAAYKRLRQNGLQPVRIDGAAAMESQATTRFEVESGQIMLGQEKKIAEATDILSSAGADIYTPNATPKAQVAS